MIIELLETDQEIDLEYLRLEYKHAPKVVKNNRAGVNLKAVEGVDPLEAMYDINVGEYEWLIDGYTKELIESLGEFTRCRYLSIGPQFCMKIHSDYKERYHIPIHTNEYCGFFDKHLNTYKMEVGKLYRLNATHPHSAFNIDRNEWRTHLILEKA